MDVDSMKKWYQSKGILGSLGAGAASGYELYSSVHTYLQAHPDAQAGVLAVVKIILETPDSRAAAAGVLGAFLAWYGRYSATNQISNKLV